MNAVLSTVRGSSPIRERGVVTLAIGIILLLLITLVTLYGGRTTLLEQRISANDYRAQEASGTAQAGLNYGIEFAKAHQQTMRASGTDGWFDGTLDLANDNPEWGAVVDLGDCSSPANAAQEAACESGFRGSVRFFGTGFDPDNLATYDVPLDWPASSSGALADCPGADCRVAVEFVLCEFTAAPPGGDCVDAGGTVPPYAVLVLARGFSADGTAESSVRQILTPFELLPGNAIPPLMAASNITITGALDVVVNPDGAGPGSGVPISGWANDDLVLSGDASFCYPDEYFAGGLMSEELDGSDLTGLPSCNGDFSEQNQPCVADVTTSSGFCSMPICADCDCPTNVGALTRSDASVYLEGIDVVDNDGDAGPTPDAVNFPDDVFEYIFGVPHQDYEVIKESSRIVQDCSGIDGSSAGLYWVEGDCSISSVGGSPDGPVIIITEGDFRMQGGGTYFGLVFAFSDPANGIEGGTVNLRGGPEFYGTVISDHEIDISNGNFDLIFSECMLQRIRDDDTFRRLGPVPGSWADHI